MLPAKAFPDGLSNMSKVCRTSKIPCCQPNQAMSWNMTKRGVLYSKRSINAGCGRSRRTRQIIAFVIGDRSEATCRRLWNKVPLDYRSCISYSDFWEAYQKVLPQETHHAVGKESGQVSHMERWYCTLRQHQARYVRKTLSFSKRDTFHHMVTKWFIVDHNLARKQLASLTL
jgi:insertion element IS1 protein InsB